MTMRKTITVLGAVAVSALVLAACRAEEQGRITRYEPGVYLGKKDTALNAAQQDRLRQEVNRQGSAVYLPGGGGTGSKAVDTGALGTRSNIQRQP